jgi:hypothetical protein
VIGAYDGLRGDQLRSGPDRFDFHSNHRKTRRVTCPPAPRHRRRSIGQLQIVNLVDRRHVPAPSTRTLLLWWLFILATRQALRVAVALCNRILPGRLFHCEQAMLQSLAEELCIYGGSPPTGTGTCLTEKAKAHSPFGVRQRRDASRRIPLGDQICVQGISGHSGYPRRAGEPT